MLKMAVCKHMKLRASLQIGLMLFGEEHHQVKDIITIMDLTDKFMSIEDKRPEDQMLFHTSLVAMRNMTQIRINSFPEV